MTAKSQLNIRISPASREKLDYLTTRYGTQAEVISVAIDRLYQSEMTDPFERELWQAGDFGSDQQDTQHGTLKLSRNAGFGGHWVLTDIRLSYII